MILFQDSSSLYPDAIGTELSITDALQNVLWSQIPITRAMDVRVDTYSSAGLILSAPLAPNINHQNTAFGGSLSSLATLACWGLLWIRLKEANLQADIVIHEGQIKYTHPVRNEIEVHASHPCPDSWLRFVQTVQHHGKARLELESVVVDEQPSAKFKGKFVALRK